MAQNNLRVTRSRLCTLARKLAATDTRAGELLITNRNTAQINPLWIERADLNCFNELVERTRQHTHAHRNDCAICQATFRAAVQKVERLFNRLKHYRRLATRYDKTARNFLAFWHIASIITLLL